MWNDQRGTGLTADEWVATGIRVAVDGAPQGMPTAMVSLASITTGSNWVLNETRMKSLAANVGLRGCVTQDKQFVTSHGAVSIVALLHDQSQQ